MDQLLSLLHEVNTSNIACHDFLNESHHPAVSLIRELLYELLIDVDGSVNWDIKRELEGQKVYVYPVERDSFGWVLGAVETEKGDITFG